MKYFCHRIFECPIERSDVGPVAVLPEEKTKIPREKRIPEPKPLTRWEQFAKEKGIKNQKRERMVYDEQTDEYKPRFGYKRVKNGLEDQPIVEVKTGQDPFADPWAEDRKEKKERVEKNIKNRAKNNLRRSGGKSGNVLAYGGSPSPPPPHTLSYFLPAWVVAQIPLGYREFPWILLQAEGMRRGGKMASEKLSSSFNIQQRQWEGVHSSAFPLCGADISYLSLSCCILLQV